MDQRLMTYFRACKDIGYVPEVYWDMDGVLCNFVKGTCKLLGVSYQELIQNWPRGEYDMRKVSPAFADMSARINAAGPEFWEALEPDRKALDSLGVCASYADVYVLSAPTVFLHAPCGKLQWIHKWLGKGFEKVIFTDHKAQLSQHGRFLIDDHRMHCTLWEERRGVAILWPQPWNK